MKGLRARRSHNSEHVCVSKKAFIPTWPLSVRSLPCRRCSSSTCRAGSVRVKPSTGFHTPCESQNSSLPSVIEYLVPQIIITRTSKCWNRVLRSRISSCRKHTRSAAQNLLQTAHNDMSLLHSYQISVSAVSCESDYMQSKAYKIKGRGPRT